MAGNGKNQLTDDACPHGYGDWEKIGVAKMSCDGRNFLPVITGLFFASQ
jgi:hypothetical protein